MKIFSKFHDYYDSVLKFSQTEDDGVVYQREPEEIVFNVNQAEVKEFGDMRYFQDEHVKFIGFCGKIYPIIHVDFRDSEEVTLETFFFGIDDDKFIERHANYYKKLSRFQLDNVGSREITWKLGRQPADWYPRYNYITPFKLEEFFIRYNTPIFLFENLGWSRTHNSQNRWQLNTNICLKDYNFQRILDPFTAFQEISMFFNTTLTNLKTPEMPVGDDKVLAASKGFDKWSFRKMGKDSK